jgi:hypothetical protein
MKYLEILELDQVLTGIIKMRVAKVKELFGECHGK